MENAVKIHHFKKMLGGKFIYQDCLNFDSIFQPTDTFECYPIIIRQAQYLAWKDEVLAQDVLGAWVDFMNLLHNYYKRILRKRGMNNFLCLSFNDFDCYEGCPPIPSIYTSTVIDEGYLVDNMRSNFDCFESKEMSVIKRSFELCGISNAYHFYESRFFDVHGGQDQEIIWIYCVGKQGGFKSEVQNPSTE